MNTSAQAPTESALRSLGHRAAQWRAASASLRNRLNAEWLRPWLRAWPATTAPDSLEFHVTELTVPGPSLRWLPDQDDWLMLALLRIPTLKPLWEREISSAGLQTARDLFSPAWLLDGQALPPGHVLADWNLTDWTEILRREEAKNLKILLPDGALPLTKNNLSNALHSQGSLLIPAKPLDSPIWQASFSRFDCKKIKLLEIIKVANFHKNL